MDGKTSNKWIFPYNNFEIKNPVLTLKKISKLLFNRFLTDSCGGNISLKCNDRIYMTPTYAGEYFHWDVPKDKVMIFDLNNNLIKGNPKELSREGVLHFKIYENFPEVHGIIHAHPPHTIAWSLMHSTMSAVTRLMSSRKCPEIWECDPKLPDLSDEQNTNILEIFKRRLELDKPMSLSVLLKGHGVILADVNIFRAFSLLEAIENNAKALLYKTIIEKKE